MFFRAFSEGFEGGTPVTGGFGHVSEGTSTSLPSQSQGVSLYKNTHPCGGLGSF